MIDFERHFKRLQDALGMKNALGKNCVDVIDEGTLRCGLLEIDDREFVSSNVLS